MNNPLPFQLPFQLTSTQAMLIVALAISLTYTAVRMARMAKSLGRNPRLWFFISLFCSALPAMIVFWADARNRVRAEASLASFARRKRRRQQRQARPKQTRCPHCGEFFTEANPADSADHANLADIDSRCPHCKLPRQQETLA